MPSLSARALRRSSTDRLAASLARRGVVLPRIADMAPPPLAPAAVPAPLAVEGIAAPATSVAPVPLDAWAAFAQAVADVPHHRARPAAWWRKVAFGRWAGCCAYCGATITMSQGTGAGQAVQGTVAARLDYLIPPHLGGPDHDGAVVLCCAPCRRAKRGRDRADFTGAAQADALTRLREALALTAWNHLPLDPADGKTALAVRRLLATRWRHERWRVFVALTGEGGFFGWPTAALPPVEALYSLLALGGVRLHADGQLAGVWIGSVAQAVEGLRRAVAYNALAQLLDLGDRWPSPDLSGSGQVAAWPMTWPSIGGLVRGSRNGRSAGT